MNDNKSLLLVVAASKISLYYNLRTFSNLIYAFALGLTVYVEHSFQTE